VVEGPLIFIYLCQGLKCLPTEGRLVCIAFAEASAEQSRSRDDTSLAPDDIGDIQRKSEPSPAGVECVETVIVLRLVRRSLKKSTV